MTREFVKSSAYILKATLKKSDGPSKKGAALAKAVPRGAPLWDPKKFEIGQIFSQTQYYNVREIDGNRITVENQFGNFMHVSKDIIEKMASATHFVREIPMNMTGLAELLDSISDTVFTVKFKKQANLEGVQERLSKVKLADLKDPKKVTTLAKELTEGSDTQMTCHLVESENNLGRSTVIDLSAKTPNKFRQVDHRTIEYIIYKNAKYVLKKGAKKVEEEVKKWELWDGKDLAIGNWFSGTNYFQAKAVRGDNVETVCAGKDITVSRDILDHEMYNANAYSKEEKLALTKVVKILKNAHSTAFTVCFNCKVDEKAVADRLLKVTEKDLKDAKSLAKELLTGKESTSVCHLVSTEGKLGRSLVMGLAGGVHFS